MHCWKYYFIKFLGKSKNKNRLINLDKIEKILILRDDNIGDMILTLPLLRELKKKLPSIKIDILASSKNQDVLKYCPYIDDIIIYNGKRIFRNISSIMKVRKNKYDLIIDLYDYFTTHFLVRLRLFGAKEIWSLKKREKYGINNEDLEIIKKTFGKNEKINISERYLDVLKLFGFDEYNNQYEFFYSEYEEKIAENFYKKIDIKENEKKIILNLYGGSESRYISKEKALNIISGIINNFRDIKIILLYFPGKFSELENIKKNFDSEKVILGPETRNILEVGAIIEKGDIIISPDTSIIHIASAFNKKIIGIYTTNEYNFNAFSPKCDHYRIVFSNSKKNIHEFNENEIIARLKEIIDL